MNKVDIICTLSQISLITKGDLYPTPHLNLLKIKWSEAKFELTFILWCFICVPKILHLIAWSKYYNNLQLPCKKERYFILQNPVFFSNSDLDPRGSRSNPNWYFHIWLLNTKFDYNNSFFWTKLLFGNLEVDRLTSWLKVYIPIWTSFIRL